MRRRRTSSRLPSSACSAPAAGARRPRALARGLRLTPARALALVASEAPRGARTPAAGSSPTSSRPSAPRSSSRPPRRPRSPGSPVPWTAAEPPCSSTVRPEAARPRCTYGRAPGARPRPGRDRAVPEIALTPQAVGRFEPASATGWPCFHSVSTAAERRDERERIAAGDAPVVIGARSAISGPCPGSA